MAPGLVGCQGQFFGKQLDKMMFLGELSLDGSVRLVRGALSAALAAREFGLEARAVPEASAKEAAVVTVHAGGGDESLPVRLFRRPDAGVPLRASHDSALRFENLGPLLDRIDIHIEVPAVKYKELRAPSSAEDSASVRQRVIDARNRQLERFQSEKKTYANVQMMPKMIRKHCAISPEGEKLLENAITRLGLSARAHDRILKVARTIADLDCGSNIEPRHLSEAIQYRPRIGPIGLDSKIRRLGNMACHDLRTRECVVSENWHSYICNVNGELASVFLNLSLSKGHPTCLAHACSISGSR